MSVGNATLDSDHKKLFELTVDIDSLYKARDTAAMSHMLKRLNACMDHHFLNELLFAHALNIPFEQHQIDHQNISTAIILTRREAGKDDATATYAIKHYAQFLRKWLTKHITDEDMQMKQVLQTRPYDFKIKGADACDCC